MLFNGFGGGGVRPNVTVRYIGGESKSALELAYFYLKKCKREVLLLQLNLTVSIKSTYEMGKCSGVLVFWCGVLV